MMHRKRWVLLSGAALLLGVVWFAMPGQAPKDAPAATVQKTIKEETLNTISLSEAAEQSLGLALVPVVRQPVGRLRLYGGEIITPVARRGVVTAPFGGILRGPTSGIPHAGQVVKKGDVIVVLLPLLTMEARSASATAQVDAGMQVDNATTQLQAAANALARAKRLFADKVGARRTVEETQAAYDIAAKTLEAARERQSLLEESLNVGTAAPIEIAAPEDGVLRKVSVAHGQNVPGGTTLFEMGDLSTAWVRATLPGVDLEDIARDRPAQVGGLSTRVGAKTQAAAPVISPPIANPQASTVDLLYALHSSGEEAVPGQRVGVMLPLNDGKNALTVPSGAVVFDALGGAWVYAQTAPHTYARQRVSVSYVSGEEAVLNAGPLEGTMVVSIGAQTLFGAETGSGK